MSEKLKGKQVSGSQVYLDELNELHIPDLYEPTITAPEERLEKVQDTRKELDRLRERILAAQDELNEATHHADAAQARLNMLNMKPLSVLLDKITELEMQLTSLERAKEDELPPAPQIGDIMYGDYVLDIWKIGTSEQKEAFAEYVKVAMAKRNLKAEQDKLRARAVTYKDQADQIRETITSTEKRIRRGPISFDSILAVVISVVLVTAFLFISSNIDSPFTSQWGYMAAGFGFPTLMVLGSLYGLTDHFTKFITARQSLPVIRNELTDLNTQRLILKAEYIDLAEKIDAISETEKAMIATGTF